MKKNAARILAISVAAWPPTLWQRIVARLGFGPSAQERAVTDEHANAAEWQVM